MPDDPFNNPFGKLKLDLPPGKPQPQPQPQLQPAAPRGPARAVVRMERKGRGGKEVTAVEQLELKPKELELWLKELKNLLGCGGTIEGDAIVLQGDQRKRLPKLLEEKGVRKVITS